MPHMRKVAFKLSYPASQCRAAKVSSCAESHLLVRACTSSLNPVQ